MQQGTFIIEQVFDVPVEKIWEAITDPGKMKQWYFDIAYFRPEIGFSFQFAAGPEGKSYLHKCVVTAVVPLKLLAYTWRYEDHSGNSEVTFELSNDNGKTKLVLTHTGLNTFPAGDPNFAPESFAKGWTYIIGTSLKAFAEK